VPVTTAARGRRRRSRAAPPDLPRRSPLLLAGALAFLATFAERRAAAEPAPTLTFSADHAEVDLEERRAALRGHVVVEAARARLTADRLAVAHVDTDKIQIDGPATLVWCLADDPPLRLRFARAELRDDLVVVHDASLRVLGGRVPIAYFPWFSLRGPSRWGLLAPSLALRATDGALVSAGVHAPITRTWGLDVQPGLYVRGGGAVSTTLRSGAESIQTRWDQNYEGRGLFAARGALAFGGVGSVEVDVLRGERGRQGTSELDVVARPYDRASASVHAVNERLSVGAQLRMLGRRVDGEPVYAPRLVLATGRTYGAIVGAGIIEVGTFFTKAGEGRPLARFERDATATIHLGIVRMRGTFRGAFLAEGSDDLRTHSFALGFIDAGIPLRRRFERTLHTIDPGASLAVVGGLGRSELPNGVSPEQHSGLSAVPAGRLFTALEGAQLRAAARLAGGALVDADQARVVYRGAALLDADAGGVRADVYGIGLAGTVTTVLVEAGETKGATLFGQVAFRRGEDSLVARGLASDLPPAFSAGSYAFVGATQSAGLRLPFGDQVALGARIDGDLDQSRVLAGVLGLGYAHRCGCLGASVVSASRVGRAGVDTLFVLDLAPPPGSGALAQAGWSRVDSFR
jgi:hypothetical protein